MNCYTYIYLDPRKPGKYSYNNLNLSFLFEPFYVGKGRGYRIDEHLSAKIKNSKQWDKNYEKAKIIYDIFECGLEPIRFKTDLFKSKKKQQKREYELIKKIGRKKYNLGPLTNILPGKEKENPGEARKGKSLEELYGKDKANEWKKNISRSLNLHPENNPGAKRKGKKLEDCYNKDVVKIWKENMSKATKGKNNPRYIKFPEKTMNQIKEMYLKNITITDIAKKINQPWGIVDQKIKELGIKRPYLFN